jgi:hypothetical protein
MPLILIKSEGVQSLPRLRYVLQFLQQHPLAPEGVLLTFQAQASADCTIYYYGVNQNLQLRVKEFAMPALGQFFASGMADAKLLLPQSVEFHGHALHGIQSREAVFPYGKFVDDGGWFGFDVFETIFFHISRYEEWQCTQAQVDEHGRMRSGEMFLVRHGLHRQPVVDQLVAAFYGAIGLGPRQLKTSLRLTHDIDILEKYPSFFKFLRAEASMVFYQRSLEGLLGVGRQYFRKVTGGEPDPFDTYAWLFRQGGVGERLVYFLAGGRRRRLEGHFSMESPRARQVLQLAEERGYAIGLHPSYDSPDDERIFRKEKQTLEAVAGRQVEASRQHFLRWRFPDTPRVLEAGGIAEDSTLGFSDMIGFRCGTGFGYRLYNFEAERPWEFREVPPVVMDVALLREAGVDFYRPYGNAAALSRTLILLDEFLAQNQHQTQITFIFHNSTFDEVYIDAPSLRQKYLALFG